MNILRAWEIKTQSAINLTKRKEIAMKKTNAGNDKSAPYRSFDYGKIDAPTKAKNQPRSTVISGKKDLRGGKA